MIPAPDIGAGSRHRWRVLGIGVFAQASVGIAFFPGLSAVAPALGATYRLDLAQIGLLFTALQVGFLITVVPWGVVADRRSDRLALTAGLGGATVALVAAALTTGYVPLLVAMLVASMLASSTNVASARVAVAWFRRHERGLALGIRQMSVPLGGVVAALLLPALATGIGTHETFLVLAALCGVAAVVAAIGLGLAPAIERRPPEPGSRAPVRDPRLIRLGLGVGLLVLGQNSLLAYFVLFLTEYRHVGLRTAALAFLFVQLGAALIRVGGGRLSDQLGSRVRPMCWASIGLGVLLVAAIVVLDLPLVVVVPVMVAASIVSMSITGLSYTAAAEIAGIERAGVAVGLQVTILSVAGSLGPAAFGQVVTLAGWRYALGMLAILAAGAALVLRPLLVMERREWRIRASPAETG